MIKISKEIFTLALLALSLLAFSTFSQSAIITHAHGVKEKGRIGEITNTGFQFFGERFVFLEFENLIDIEADPALSGTALAQEKKIAKRITQLLDKEWHLKSKLGIQTRKWLKQGEYSALQEKAKNINSANARWPTGRWQIHSFYQGMTSDISESDAPALNQRITRINDWIQKNPQSATAKISLMGALNKLAWAHRGSGFSNTVSQGGMKKFLEILKKSIDIGLELRANNPKDLMLYNYLIQAENAYGADKNHLIKLAKESAAIDPIFYLPYIRTMEGLLPKWGGYHGQVEEFSRWFQSLIPIDSPEVVFQAHRALKHRIKDETYVHMNFDWERLQSGFESFRKTYQAQDSDIHLMAKIASLHGDQPKARDYFAQTDGSWNYMTQKIWVNQEVLENFKTWANSNPDTKTKELTDAIVKNNFKLFSLLLDAIGQAHSALFEKDIFGNTLLHRLAITDADPYLDQVSRLSINLDQYNAYGYTALQLAVDSGLSRNVEILLKNGADISLSQQHNKSGAAHIAAANGFVYILSILVKSEPSLFSAQGYNGALPLHFAALNGHFDTVRYLLNVNQENYSAQDDYGYTPLHYSIARGHLDIVKLLVNRGADTALKNHDGHTPLSYARSNNFTEIVRFLQSVNAPDANVVDQSEKFNKAHELYEQSRPYFNQRDYKKAKAIYFEALEIAPDYYLPYAGLAQIAFDFEKDYIQADKYLDESIRLNPNYFENYYWKARTNYELARPEVYKPLFTKYVQLVPDSYNSQDLKKNWPHLLDQESQIKQQTNASKNSLIKISEPLGNSSHIMIAILAILILLLILIRIRKAKINASSE